MLKTDYIGLHNLVAIKARLKKTKRVGRGESSGHGKTSGRGHKGQKARKSGCVRIGFEGGQNPLNRRIPKRGFSNSSFKINFSILNLKDISKIADTNISINKLQTSGIVSKTNQYIKLLSNGEIGRLINIECHAASRAAIEKVEALGGTVKIIEGL